MPGMAWIAGADGETQYINLRGLEYGGLTGANSDASLDWISLVHPQEMRGTRAAWRRALKRSDRFHLECRLRRHDGIYRWHICNASPASTREDENRWIGSATDIEDLKRHEGEMRHTSAQQGKTFGLLTTLEESAPVGLGYVDLNFNIVRANQQFLALSGLPAAHKTGQPLAEVLPDIWPQIGASLQEVLARQKPCLNREVSRTHAATGHVQHWVFSFFPVIIGKAVVGIGLVAMDITERHDYVMRLESALMRSVEVAMTLSELRDPYTAGHERRVADLAVAIGQELGLGSSQLQGLRVAGYLHDIGKITVPVEILAKSGPLSQAEFMLIRGHPQAGHDVLKNVEFPWPVAKAILQHHERIDGSGYPRCIGNGDIILEARILAVADVVEAMSSHRPYRPALGIDRALAEVQQGRGNLYDTDVADACLRLFREKGYARLDDHA